MRKFFAIIPEGYARMKRLPVALALVSGTVLALLCMAVLIAVLLVPVH